MPPLYSKIEQLCALKGVNITQMCRDAGVPRASLSDYKMGRRQTLGVAHLQKMAAYFGVTVDYLIDDDNTLSAAAAAQNTHDVPSQPGDKEFVLAELSALPEQAQAAALDYIRFLIKKYEGEG